MRIKTKIKKKRRKKGKLSRNKRWTKQNMMPYGYDTLLFLMLPEMALGLSKLAYVDGNFILTSKK